MDFNEKNLPEQENAEETAAVNEAVEETVETAEEAVTEEPVKAAAPQPPVKTGEKSFARLLRTEKFKRGGMATLLTVVFVAVVVAVNLIASVLSARFPSMNIDLTAQKLNTLSDQAQRVAKEGVTNETEIFLIGSEEAYRKNQLYSSYGLEFSQVANLAERLAEANPLISVEFVDPDLNPAFIAQYSEDGLTSGYVVVRTEKRSKTLNPSDLFAVQPSSGGYSYDTYSNVDSALAGALEIVNMENVPVIAVAVGSHQEMLASTLTEFEEMMENQNFEIRHFDIMTEPLPENTQVLMIPTPSTDYTPEEVQIVRDFLNDTTREEPLTVLLTCHPTQGPLPNLERLLEEWGVEIQDGTVAESDASRKLTYDDALVLVNKNDEIFTDYYNYLVSIYSAPLKVLFEGNGNIGTTVLWSTADSAYVLTDEMRESGSTEGAETASQTTAVMSSQFVKVNGENYRRYLLTFGSSLTFSDGYVSTSSFGNGQFIRDLMRYTTETGGSSVTVYANQVQTNTLDITMPAGTVTLLGLGVFTAGLPLVILVLGLLVFLKRRHL